MTLIGDELFAVLLADDLIDAEMPVIGEMIKVAREFHGSVLAIQQVRHEHTGQYGIVSGVNKAHGVYVFLAWWKGRSRRTRLPTWPWWAATFLNRCFRHA